MASEKRPDTDRDNDGKTNESERNVHSPDGPGGSPVAPTKDTPKKANP
jgi:hypothetical protein